MINVMKTLAPHSKSDALDRILDPFTRCLTPAVARSLVEFRADSPTQARIAELGDKCNDGVLTATERDEYEAYVQAIDLISVFQSKARRYLAGRPKS
jgi:hypothetical protein